MTLNGDILKVINHKCQSTPREPLHPPYRPTYQSYANYVCQITPGACEQVASDLGLGGGFHQVFRFPPPVTTG